MSIIIKLLLAACLLFRLTNCNTTNDDDSDGNISVCMANTEKTERGREKSNDAKCAHIYFGGTFQSNCNYICRRQLFPWIAIFRLEKMIFFSLEAINVVSIYDLPSK